MLSHLVRMHQDGVFQKRVKHHASRLNGDCIQKPLISSTLLTLLDTLHVVGFPILSNSAILCGYQLQYPTLQFHSDTIYLKSVSNPTS